MFPSLWLAKRIPYLTSPMFIALPERPNPSRHDLPFRSFDPDERLILLQHIYLEAGLPPRAAMMAARADLLLSFDEQRCGETP